MIDLELAYSDAALVEAVRTAASANGLRDAHVRILVTRGRGLPGIDPRRCPQASVLVLVYPFPPLLGSDAVTLLVSNVVRKAPRSVDPGTKSLNYLDSVLAKIQANAAGVGDALMLDGQGLVAEATGTNVFCVSESTLRTPPLTASLPGVTRRTVIELADENELRVAVEALTVGDLYAADEVFLTGTAAGIVPVSAIDGRELPESPGPLTRVLMHAYRATWTDPRYTTRIV
jgi:branched-chain amino acid aminotransferase